MTDGRPLGVLERRGAEVDALGADLERVLERLVVADAARELDVDAAHLADRLLQDRRVRAAAERRVEVDEVDPLGALIGPVHGRVDGVAVVRLGARLALRQADSLAAGDVDGRKQHQAGGLVELTHHCPQESSSGIDVGTVTGS